MLLDSGVLTLCRLENTAPDGAMPRMRLVPVERCFYGERTVGYNRQYAALGVNERVDLLARVWQSRAGNGQSWKTPMKRWWTGRTSSLSRRCLRWIRAGVRAAVRLNCFPAWFPAGNAAPQW